MNKQEDTIENLVERALTAVKDFDMPSLQDVVRSMENHYGWDVSHDYLSEKVVQKLTKHLGTQPNVGDIINFVHALFPYTSEIINISNYEYEFFIRGLAGAEIFLNDIPINVAVLMEITILSCVDFIQPGQFMLGEPAYDMVERKNITQEQKIWKK